MKVALMIIMLMVVIANVLLMVVGNVRVTASVCRHKVFQDRLERLGSSGRC